MRVLLVLLALFVYVVMDITVNHGATLRGWIALINAMMYWSGLR